MCHKKYQPYSYSKISTFVACPKQFEFQYIQKVKSDFQPSYFQKGISVHKIFSKYPHVDSTPIQDFFATDVGRKYVDILNDNPQREVKFGFDDNFNVVSYSNTNLYCGVIDLLYVKDNVIHIVDWKTGKAVKHSEQDWSQLEMYAAAFLPVFDVNISYVYVNHGVENIRKYTKSQRAQIIANLNEKINRIESCQEFKPNISWRCNYCKYNKICKHLE